MIRVKVNFAFQLFTACLKPYQQLQNKNVDVRFMTKDDINKVHALCYEAFYEQWIFAYENKSFELSRVITADSYKSNEEKMKNVLIATVDNEIIGMCELSFYKRKSKTFTIDFFKSITHFPLKSMIITLATIGMYNHIATKEPGEATVDFLAVNKYSRGLGVGKILLSKADELAMQKSCNKISLLVVFSNYGARRFYEKCGYSSTKAFIFKKWFLWGNEGAFKMEKNLLPNTVH
ncbi:DgyrCDS14698 [Dimorphilus gyrociliatus]|uniref:DgyrCDS14698 n=1 Tax=Dimorphilus gyrociliatus TaxID=2664684 RepID=A0A7I8WEJ5_9ANNE|nr:DgyrCDS14698 [Dimorphilus gyrociliatus]